MTSFKKIKKEIKLLLHQGDTFECPFCNYKSKDFKMIGRDFPVLYSSKIVGGGRRKAGCYKCGSTDRERLVYIYLKEILKIYDRDKDLNILHIAPEENLTKHLSNSGFKEYICGDIITEGYYYPDYVQNVNVLDIQFEANRFDIIICNHVLEHVEDDHKAMSELYRVLKIGGKAILQVPISKTLPNTVEDFSVTDPEERKKLYGQSDHVRIYGQDYIKRLTKSGFTTEKINISNEFEKFGLNIDEDIYVGSK